MDDLIPGIPRQHLAYVRYRDEVAEDCDLLLWEPTSLYGRGIAVATHGPFCHVSAVVHLEKRLMQAGYEERRGGIITPLSGEVRRHPDKISVFRVDQLRGLDQVRAHLVDRLDGDYDMPSIRLLILGHLLGIRWLVQQGWYRRRVRDASLQTAGAHCAKHIARCFALGAGISFIHREFAETSPNDIGLSGICRYLGTLVP